MPSHDPKKTFVVFAMTRADIAERLNSAIDAPDEADAFSEDDPRLTDEVCQEIADLVWDGMADPAEAILGSICGYVHRMPESMRRK